jgi:hypothetical protein
VNVLDFDSEDAIKEVTVQEALQMYKDVTIISQGDLGSRGSMFRYQDTQMDEQDIATHSYRSSQN